MCIYIHKHPTTRLLVIRLTAESLDYIRKCVLGMADAVLRGQESSVVPLSEGTPPSVKGSQTEVSRGLPTTPTHPGAFGHGAPAAIWKHGSQGEDTGQKRDTRSDAHNTAPRAEVMEPALRSVRYALKPCASVCARNLPQLLETNASSPPVCLSFNQSRGGIYCTLRCCLFFCRKSAVFERPALVLGKRVCSLHRLAGAAAKRCEMNWKKEWGGE